MIYHCYSQWMDRKNKNDVPVQDLSLKTGKSVEVTNVKSEQT